MSTAYEEYQQMCAELDSLRAQVAVLREFAERVCGDGCHCMEENAGRCLLASTQEQEDD